LTIALNLRDAENAIKRKYVKPDKHHSSTTLNQPGVDFTNILCKALTRTDPKSAKKTDGLTAFFALL